MTFIATHLSILKPSPSCTHEIQTRSLISTFTRLRSTSGTSAT
jgi:hypothetical protein